MLICNLTDEIYKLSDVCSCTSKQTYFHTFQEIIIPRIVVNHILRSWEFETEWGGYLKSCEARTTQFGGSMLI